MRPPPSPPPSDDYAALSFSEKAAVIKYRAQRSGIQILTSATHPELVEAYEAMAAQLGKKAGKLILVPSVRVSATAVPGNNSIVVTTALLDALEHPDRKEVIGHEMGHIKHTRRDFLLRLGTPVAAAVGLGFAANTEWFDRFIEQAAKSHIVPIPKLPMKVIFMAAVWKELTAAAMRASEYGADREGARLTGTPEIAAKTVTYIDGLNREAAAEIQGAKKAPNGLDRLAEGLADYLTNHYPSAEQRAQRLRALAERNVSSGISPS
jgi:Zn-dependent protease with chaperone function